MSINGINPNAAIGAYLNSQRITGGEGDVTVQNALGGTQGLGANQSAGETKSFSDFLENQIETSLDTMKYGEQMAAKAVTGEADLTDIVQAVTQAEITLQTVVTVRDKMISAYQDIIRMQI
ncbi:MAG: flagellar hook-basal body complex protein FliE [Alphaproteobacteria bacterium]